jgi:hypothetical protein
MPVANRDLKKVKNERMVESNIAKPIDNQVINISQYLDGYPWKVNLYIQNRTTGDNIDIFDPNLPGSKQSYTLIQDMVIFVQEPIQPSHPEEITGEAIVDIDRPVNLGDLFVTDVLSGGDAIFNITNSEAINYSGRDLFKITYNLSYSDIDEPEVFNSLNSRVTKEFIYDRNAIGANITPIVRDKEYGVRVDISELYNRVLDNHLYKFMDRDLKTLLLPTEGKVIDLNLNRFIDMIVNKDESPFLLDMKLYYEDHDDIEYGNKLLWDYLIERNINGFKNSKTTYGKEITSLTDVLGSRNLAFSGINYRVVREGESIVFTNGGGINPFSKEKGEMYVITDDLYDLIIDENSTIFEKNLKLFLNNESLVIEDVVSLTNSIIGWSDENQFYLTPIILLMLKDIKTRSYTRI